MRFSTKNKNVIDTPKTDDYLRSFQRGETKVRWLEEIDEWEFFREHYTMENKSFPCLTDNKDVCPGCTSENERVRKSARKYATNILNVDSGQVYPVRVPVSLKNKMETRGERNGGTITSRDYTVIRVGTGLETDYDVDQEPKYDVDLAMYLKSAKDIPTILEKTFASLFGDPDEYVRTHQARNAVVQQPTPVVEEEEDELEITEEELREMDLTQLKELASEVNVNIDGIEDRKVIIDRLLFSY